MEKDIYKFKFEFEDTGFCRAIYSYTTKSGNKRLYCVQEEYRGFCMIYSCTEDEEPISEISFKEGVIVKFEPSGNSVYDNFLSSLDLLDTPNVCNFGSKHDNYYHK